MNSFWEGFEKQAVSGKLYAKALASRASKAMESGGGRWPRQTAERTNRILNRAISRTKGLKDVSARKVSQNPEHYLPPELLLAPGVRSDLSSLSRWKDRQASGKVVKMPAPGAMDKAAELTLDDIEDHLGVYLRDKKDREYAERAIQDATARSVAIRHPILTGIPTLGIWPAIAHGKATRKITGDLKRQSDVVRKDLQENYMRQKREEDERHKREVALMPKHIEERKRESYENMLGSALVGGLAAQRNYYDSKKDRDEA